MKKQYCVFYVSKKSRLVRATRETAKPKNYAPLSNIYAPAEILPNGRKILINQLLITCPESHWYAVQLCNV